MRVLLTGGSGFLGSFTAEQLAADGHVVRALVRPRSDKRVLEKLPRRIEQVKGGGIQPRTAELLELRGLLEPLLQQAAPGDPLGGHFAALPVPLDCTPWQTRHPFPIGIPQWEIEEVLEERAIAGGARVLRGTAVSGVESDDSGVTMQFSFADIR